MAPSRTKKSVINIGFNFANQIIMLLLTFISRTIFIHTLGVEYLGINGLFSDVLGLLSMADLGFNTAMVYSFYKPLANNDYRKMAALTTFYKKVYNFIAMAVSVCGILVIPFLRYMVNLDSQVANLEIIYVLSLSNIVASYLCVYKTSIINADQNGYIVTRISMIMNISKTIIQIIVLLVFKNYILYLIVGAIINILNNVIASKKAEKLYPFINDKVSLKKDERKEIFGNLKSVFLYKASSVLLNATDNILISTIVGTVAVGYYSNYLMVMTKVSLFYGLIFSSMTASVGNLIVREGPERRYNVFRCQQSVSYIISGVVIPCYIVLINDLLGVWLGQAYIFDIKVVVAIGINMYLGCVLQPLWSYREATGMYKKTKWVMVCCAIINIILSIVMGMHIGIMGIILASAISRVITYVWIEPMLLFRQYFEKSPARYYVGLILNVTFIAVMVIVLMYLFRNFVVNSWLKLIIKAVIVLIICVILLVLLYSKTEGIKLLKAKVQSIICKN